MTKPLPIRIREQQCWLSPERCLYWEEEQTLVLTDLHVGKTGHFRKAGIAVPQEVFKEDLHRLLQQVHHFQPKRIVLTGDLFHSDANQEHLRFARWRESIATPKIHLVRGNHDRLPDRAYTDLDLILHDHALTIGPFAFVHDPADLSPNNADDSDDADDSDHAAPTKAANASPSRYVFSGHLHPGIRLSGLGKQSMRFPCFHLTDTHAVLPAFSKFTGMHLVQPAKRDKIFAVLPESQGPGSMPSILQLL